MPRGRMSGSKRGHGQADMVTYEHYWSILVSPDQALTERLRKN